MSGGVLSSCSCGWTHNGIGDPVESWLYGHVFDAEDGWSMHVQSWTDGIVPDTDTIDEDIPDDISGVVLAPIDGT
jgi:hypothetical protein